MVVAPTWSSIFRGTCLARPVEHVTPYLRVMSSRPTLDVKLSLKKKKKAVFSVSILKSDKWCWCWRIVAAGTEGKYIWHFWITCQGGAEISQIDVKATSTLFWFPLQQQK